jgi:hypothetical protein
VVTPLPPYLDKNITLDKHPGIAEALIGLVI